MQKIWIIEFFFETGYSGRLNFSCYYVKCTPASKPFDHAWIDIPEAKTCTADDPTTGYFKTSYFCRILDKCNQRGNTIRLIGDPDNQRPDKWSSTVLWFICEIYGRLWPLARKRCIISEINPKHTCSLLGKFKCIWSMHEISNGLVELSPVFLNRRAAAR